MSDEDSQCSPAHNHVVIVIAVVFLEVSQFRPSGWRTLATIICYENGRFGWGRDAVLDSALGEVVVEGFGVSEAAPVCFSAEECVPCR